MKINKKLQEASSFNPTDKTHKMTVLDMCKKIEDNEITLPLYQRDVSWTKRQVIALLNYQLLGKAPVSPISMNVIQNTDNCVPQVSFVDREVVDNVEKGQYSVVDGQQRLTTNFKAYSDDEEYRNIVLDVTKGRFILEDGAFRESEIPVGTLLNKSDSAFYDYLAKHSILLDQRFTSVLVQCRSKIRNYSYTINQADNLSEDEQIEWFEVLNNAGSRVSALQMRFSKMKMHGVDIYTQYTLKYKDKVVDAGYEFFSPQKTSVSYPIAALNPAYEVLMNRGHIDAYAPIPSDTKENQLCMLDSEQLVRCFDITLAALDKALDFIHDNDVDEPDRIDYINYLLGYFVFCGSANVDNDYLINWYKKVDFENMSNTDRRKLFTRLVTGKGVD